MGIKNLNKILQKYAANCFVNKHLSEFSYKRVAIDISLYLYKYKAIAGDRWIDSFVYLINCLRKWNIHCIFVYDNKAPIEKKKEQERRQEVRGKQSDRLADLEHDLEIYENGGEASEKLFEIGMVSYLRKRIDIKTVKQKIESMKSMIISITDEDLKLSRNLFDLLKIPYVIAPNEAEAYSSYLCIHGKVDAVLSEDTDVLAYGAPIFLSKIDTFNNTVVMIDYECMLTEMKMTKETFLDLCIMFGCDYNSNIPKIGPEKSLALLLKHKSIDEIDLDKGILNHIRVRELFSIPEIDYYVPYCGIPDFEKVSTFFKEHGVRFDFNILSKNLGQSEISFIE